MPARKREKELEGQLEEARAVISALTSGHIEDLFLPETAAPLLVREARAVLAANERRFRILVENTSDAIALLGPDGRVLYVSPAITAMLGYEPAALTAKLGFAFLHPRDRKRMRKLFARAIWDGAVPLRDEVRGRHADGSWRDLELSLVSRLEDPSVDAMIVTFRDVTDRKLAEATLGRLASIVESSHDAIIGKDLDGVITSWNAGAERMYGYPAEEAIGRPIAMLAPADRPDEVPRMLRRLARGERVEPFDTVRARKDGSRLDVSLTVSPIHDRTGRVVGASAIARDVSERKRADAALRHSEERYRALMEQANDAILVVAPRRGTILEANRRAEQVLGRPRAELVGMTYDDLVEEGEKDASFRIREALLAQGTIAIANRHLRRPDGSLVPMDISAATINVGDEPLLLGILRDVTDRQRTEDALRRSATRLKAVLDAALDAVIGMDSIGNVVSWNPRAEAIFGWTKEEAVGRSVASLVIPPAHRQAHTQGLERFLATGVGSIVGRRVEMSALRKDGETFPIELSVVAVENDGATLFTAFVADITERTRAVVRLAESEQQYRLLFDASPQPMWVFDEQSRRFLAVNDAALARYGWSREEFLSMSLPDIHSTEFVEPLRESLSRAEVDRRPVTFGAVGGWKHRTKDGALIDVEGGATAILFRGQRAWLAYVIDVTERRKLEAQLRQAQKIESVGRLAAGIAHDFNNMLSVITGYGEILGRRMPNDTPLRRYVDDILKAAGRATALTRQLLAFSRQQVLQLGIHDVNAIVVEIEKMLRRLIGEDVELATVLGEDLAPIRADVGQVQQVLMNLVVNARDAMPRGGRISVETSTVLVDESYTALHPEAAAGRYTVIAVGDTGHGIPPEVQSRIFEPFFTTKAPGKGTGLGLATVHGIVKQSGGHIFVYSEPGRGTTFKVYLPAAEGLMKAPGAVLPAEALPSGSGTVLLVEDEPSLRAIIQEILEEGGYSVLNAPDAPAARLFSENAGTIDLLITDVVMPGTGGRELARELTVRRPEMRVLYMSGYTDDAVVLHGVLTSEMPFLEKPFTAASLLRKVREVLEGR